MGCLAVLINATDQVIICSVLVALVMYSISALSLSVLRWHGRFEYSAMRRRWQRWRYEAFEP